MHENSIISTALKFDDIYSVSQKNPPPTVFWNFFPNGWEFLMNFYTPIILSFLH